jgi:hypothetical protein
MSRVFPALLALAISHGCGGYADLPVAERLFAPATVEATLPDVPLRDGPTRLQLRLDSPTGIDADALPKPWVIVGHPTMLSAGARVIAWAVGPCDSAPDDGAMRLCLAVRWTDSDALPELPLVTVVVEARATAQRVTFVADAAADAAVEAP